MHCQNCGNEIKPGVKFCTGCGTPSQLDTPPVQQAPPQPISQPPQSTAPQYPVSPTQGPVSPVDTVSAGQGKTPFYKTKGCLIAVGVLLVIGFIVSLFDNGPDAPAPVESNVVEYNVTDEENLDHGNARRAAYHIEVAQGTTDKQIDATLKVAVKELAKERDIDAMEVFIYFSDTEMAYAKAIWAPEGKWRKADKDADRDSFEITIERLSGNRPSKEDTGERFGLDMATRKQVYKEAVAAERRGRTESEVKHPNPNDWEKQMELANQLQEQYKQELAERYTLTREQLDQVGVEGLEGNWSMK